MSDNDFGVLDQRAINTTSSDTANISTLIDFNTGKNNIGSQTITYEK